MPYIVFNKLILFLHNIDNIYHEININRLTSILLYMVNELGEALLAIGLLAGIVLKGVLKMKNTTIDAVIVILVVLGILIMFI